MQHNCARYTCSATGSRAVRQERAQTEQTLSVIEHSGDLEDVLLNLYQMRSTHHLHQFRAGLPSLDGPAVIGEWVKGEVEARKARAAKLAAAQAAKGHSMANRAVEKSTGAPRAGSRLQEVRAGVSEGSRASSSSAPNHVGRGGGRGLKGARQP